MKVDDTVAEILVGSAAAFGMIFFIIFGRMSDRVGRKKPIVWGYALTLVSLFPLFWIIGSAANPGLAAAAKNAPVVVAGQNCAYDAFAQKQGTACGRTLDHLTKKGVPYTTVPALSPNAEVDVRVGSVNLTDPEPQRIDAALADAGYDFSKQTPSTGNLLIILAALLALGALSGATYGPVAALLSEMFPPRIRYSSMSIPYHFGTGYFGGFLPLIASYIVATTGDFYAGLWYTFAVVLMALLVAMWGLPSGKPTDFKDG